VVSGRRGMMSEAEQRLLSERLDRVVDAVERI
jgi:hypothetical protein